MNEKDAIKFAIERAAHTGRIQCLRLANKRFMLATLQDGDAQRDDYFMTICPDGTAIIDPKTV